jgi:SAM-dependent methyltransferase
VAEAGNPIAWNRYAYVYDNPVNLTDSSGHLIDTLLDVLDLANNIQNCLSDSDTLSCYMVPVSVAFVALPFLSGGGAIEPAAKRRILVAGENGSFEYSLKLREALGPEYDIVATSYERAEKLEYVPAEALGFKVRTGIDATNLGSHFPNEKFDMIIFNNPRALKGWRVESAKLVEDVLASAPDVLRPGGEIRFSASGGGPAARNLRALSGKGVGYHGFSIHQYRSLEPIDYTSDALFGVTYIPLKSNGQELGFGVDKMKWFQLLP